ncbi:hypothetical protein G9A89_007820 [Geosiphon pyriformis]|nr:hypothetical protein G9A89_007820 [Geosiphon pyriformis]
MQQKLLLLLNEQNNEHTSIYKYFYIGKTLYERKLELEATNLTPEAIQKQIYNEFKTAAGLTNTCYKLRAAFRLYDLFNTCENVLQNPILQPMKVQYIGKLTELKFQQFLDQITSIILDHYLNITDSAWTSMELSLEEEIMLPQDTTQATLFELVYSRTAILPVEIEVNTYPMEPITEENFQETLLRKTYDLTETLENKQKRAADNIQKS